MSYNFQQTSINQGNIPTLNKSSQYIKDINSLIQKNSMSQSQHQSNYFP